MTSRFADIERVASALADSNRVEDAWRLRGLGDRAGNRPKDDGAGPYAADYNEGYGTTLLPFTASPSAEEDERECCYCGAAPRLTNVGPSGATWLTCGDLDCLAQGGPA